MSEKPQSCTAYEYMNATDSPIYLLVLHVQICGVQAFIEAFATRNDQLRLLLIYLSVRNIKNLTQNWTAYRTWTKQSMAYHFRGMNMLVYFISGQVDNISHNKYQRPMLGSITAAERPSAPCNDDINFVQHHISSRVPASYPF